MSPRKRLSEEGEGFMDRIWGLVATAVLCGANPAHQAADWSGEWITDLGRMELRQKKGRVEGDYGEEGSLRGEVLGGRLEFEWNRGKEAGDRDLRGRSDGRAGADRLSR